jgi:hypothetical protein
MSQNETKAKDTQCMVCRRPRHTLRPRKSKLKPNTILLLCNECFEAGREPRYLVVLMARKDGVAAVRDYIRGHKYYGDKILLEEIT